MIDENQDLTRFCSNCGAKVFIDDRFCGTCGISRKDALGEFDPKLEETATVDDLPAEEPEQVNVQSKNNNSLKWITGLSIAAVLVIGVVAVAGNNSNNSTQESSANSPAVSATPTASATPTPKPKSTHEAKPTHSAAPTNQCRVDNQSVTDLVAYKNVVATVPTGSNDANHQNAILQWVDSANSVAQAIGSDVSSDSGRVTSQMQNAADVLTSLASLASDWANNSLADPANFASQYNKLTSSAQSAYSAIVSTCGSQLPGF